MTNDSNISELTKQNMERQSQVTADTAIHYYFIEGQEYSQEDLSKAKLHLSTPTSNETSTIGRAIESLCSYTFTSLQNDDQSSAEKQSSTKALERTSKGKYKFNFVGILFIYDCVFFVFPKFMKPDEEGKFIQPTDKARNVMQLVIDVCDMYRKRVGSGSQNTGTGTKKNDRHVNRAELYRALLTDYMRDGAYVSRERIHRHNGNGQIDWERTIRTVDPLFSTDDKPIYADYWTREHAKNNEALVRRIQLSWIAYAAQEFANVQLLESVLRLPQSLCFVSHEKPNELGNAKKLRAELLRARNSDFSIRNRRLIDMLLLLIDTKDQHVLDTERSIAHLGTAPFHNIWEDVCRKIFNGESINFEGAPIWNVWGRERIPQQQNLIPDAVCKLGESNDIVIIDAKYYTPQPSANGITNQPGNYDVVKEYMYQLLIDNYYAQQGTVRANAFMFPERFTIGNAPSENLYRVQGDVRLKFLTGYKLGRKHDDPDEMNFANEFLPITYVDLNPIRAFQVYTNRDSINRDEELKKLIDLSSKVRHDLNGFSE